jgi:hypothetical protein
MKKQIKSQNVMMRVTDNPVGSNYRLPVKGVASAQLHTAISAYRIRQPFPFCDRGASPCLRKPKSVIR